MLRRSPVATHQLLHTTMTSTAVTMLSTLMTISPSDISMPRKRGTGLA